MSKPLKIKLKDHHADNDQFACVNTIREYYEISEEKAFNLLKAFWDKNDDNFSDIVINRLDDFTYIFNCDKKVETKTSFTEEDMEKAFDAGTYFGNGFIDGSFENLKEVNPTYKDFNSWLESYKNVK